MPCLSHKTPSSCEVSNAVILGLQTSIATLKERNDGRYTTNDSIALQVLSGATVFDMHGASLRSVARLLGCNREKIAHCKQLWEDYIEGERECPWDFGGGTSNTMPEAYVDSIIGWWHELTRESERMDGQMRNPHDKGDERWYKVRYREERYTDLLAEMLRRGTAKHGEEFHLGRKKMRELMPFYVKKAGKETCVCIHHLIWDKMISDYARERTALRKRMALLDPPLTCDCIIISNGHEA